MNKLGSVSSNHSFNRAKPLTTNQFDATYSKPPPIPKTAVPISSNSVWTADEAKLTKDEQAIPARFLMTTDNVESDPDEYVKNFQIKEENFTEVDLGVNNDAYSLLEMDNELPPKRMVEVVTKDKGLCGGICSGKKSFGLEKIKFWKKK
ncbi:unnamed protein product [Oikopleura dioica]|uniref:Uncharacterized protein n=1 Tax=Oikopleura dioica TaxID=34765 RepID=E4YBY1_OIKDI|nr:unnamed protein product [Oikopleura dioica]